MRLTLIKQQLDNSTSIQYNITNNIDDITNNTDENQGQPVITNVLIKF